MFIIWLAGDHLYRKKADHLSVAGDFFDGVLFFAVLVSPEMSWMRSQTELVQFLSSFYLLK